MDDDNRYLVISYDDIEDRPYVAEFKTLEEAAAELEKYPHVYGEDAIIAKKLIRRVAFDEGEEEDFGFN